MNRYLRMITDNKFEYLEYVNLNRIMQNVYLFPIELQKLYIQLQINIIYGTNDNPVRITTDGFATYNALPNMELMGILHRTVIHEDGWGFGAFSTNPIEQL